MPAYALTETGQGVCNHAGTISFTGKGAPTLTAGGQKVVTTTSIIGAPVAGCTNPPASGGPCTQVLSVAPGSVTLTAGSIAAVLATDTLTTDKGTGTITNPGNTSLQGS